MTRRGWPLWCALAGLALASCSDGDPPPPPPGELGPGDGGAGDRSREWRPPYDGFDLKCPNGPPCVYETKGEGKHKEDYAVIGERLTLSGRGLENVDTVYVGATVAPLISASATQVVCRVGPGTPSGEHSIEVAAGSSRRKATRVTVRRLVLPLAGDHLQVTGWDALTHAGGPELTLPESPAGPPLVSATGRFLLVPAGAGKALVVDLAQELPATVSGLPAETITSLATDPEDRTLALTTSGGKLLSVDLTKLPTLAAQAVSGAPATAAVARLGADKEARFVGLHPTAATGEGSLWTAPLDLKGASFAQQAGTPFVVGSGTGLQPVALSAHDATIALLAQDGAAVQLGLLAASVSGASGVGSAPVPGALGLAIAAGGKQIAIGADGASPALAHTGSGAIALKSIALGGAGASRVMPLRLPTRPALVAALSGAKPSAPAAFVASALELCDLSSGTRLTAAGKAALELAGIRAAVADTTADLVHLVVGSEYRSYAFAITGSTVTVTEKPPSRPLTTGKDYRYLVAQP